MRTVPVHEFMRNNTSTRRRRTNKKNTLTASSSASSSSSSPPPLFSTRASTAVQKINIHITINIAIMTIIAIMNACSPYYSLALGTRGQWRQPFIMKCEAFILHSQPKKRRTTCTSTYLYRTSTRFHPQNLDQNQYRQQLCHRHNHKVHVGAQRTRFLSSTAKDEQHETTTNTQTTASTTTASTAASTTNSDNQSQLIHRAEGLCAVYKPTTWTSQDVVSYIRGMLERDARDRGLTLAKRRSRKSKKKIKVGHGGTLDPLAEGVLVLGIGPSGTKSLTNYLSGSKEYVAQGKFGFETNTLDMEGNVTKTAAFDHISHDDVEHSLDGFRGKIMQVPPLFSAIRKNGKRLYEQAREGKLEEDIVIDPREVEIYKLDYVPFYDNDNDEGGLPSFGLNIQCGGGTYIRSLIRDIGYEVGSAATMTNLVRTKQGPFTLDSALPKEEWSADTIYAAVEKFNSQLSADEDANSADSGADADADAGGQEYPDKVAS